MIRALGSTAPRIHPSAFVHDAAEIIGDVSLGRRVSVWPGAVLRADVDAIRVGSETNLQDGVLVHCRPKCPAILGRGVTVGHGAIIHGARIGDLVLVGMGAVIMEAHIGRECLIAAGAVLLKDLRVPPRSLVLGFPARVGRRLTAAELGHLRASRDSYLALARRHQRFGRVLFR